MTTRLAIMLACLASLCGACVWAGMWIKQSQFDAEELARKRGESEALQASAKSLSEMIEKQEKVTERVIREVKTNTIYRDCVVPDPGIRMLNEAITGQPTDSH